MPRPKVRPEDRLRSAQACQTCKASKIRCDAQHPCTSCVRRDQPHACIYSGVDRRRRRTSALPPSPSNSQIRSPGLSEEIRTQQDVNLTSPNPKTHSSPKVYVGEASSLSFLYFLRKTVKAYVGPVSFTDSKRRHIILETDIGQLEDHSLDLSTERIYSLLQSYFEATSGILDLFTAYEIDSLVTERSMMSVFPLQPNSRLKDSAALDLALAIGAQLRGEEHDLATGYFCRARQIAFEDMLMGQDLSSVILFLLLSFYMLGACHRNAASMFLGVAAKGAIILDLHTPESYDGLMQDEYWSSLFENITDTLNKENILHVPTAENFLEQLRQWSRELSLTIRRFKTTVSSHSQSSSDVRNAVSCLSPSDRPLLVGNMHVSCIYNFAVILITRPYLIAYLMSRLRGKAPDHLITDPNEASDVTIKNNKVSKLAQVCVSSAVYMVDMCQKVKDLSLTFGNLCLLKAWVFGAGLVLGFSMFAGEPRKDIEICFESACDVLATIATTSPQAQLYHDILTSFSEAVAKHRRRVAGEVRRTVQQYMDQILVVEQTSPNINNELQLDNVDTANLNDHRSTVPPPQLSVDMPDNPGTDTSSSLPDPISDCTKGAHTLLQTASSFENEFGDWGDLDMQFSDGFLPDPEPFDQLFYTVE